MNDKLYIYIINNQKKAAIVPRPAQFGYPPHIRIGDKTYYNSGRLRYSNEAPTGESMIYTEKVHNLDLSLLEGKKPEPEPPVVHDEPMKYRVWVTEKIVGTVDVEATSKEEAEELAAERLDEVQQTGDEDYEFEAEELEDE